MDRKILDDHSVAFNDLAGSEADRDAAFLTVIFDHMHDTVKTPVQGSVMIVLVAEVLAPRSFLIPGDMHGVIDQFLYTFVLGGRDRYDRYLQHLFHLVYQYGSAIALYFIHHIESQYHRHIKFQ